MSYISQSDAWQGGKNYDSVSMQELPMLIYADTLPKVLPQEEFIRTAPTLVMDNIAELNSEFGRLHANDILEEVFRVESKSYAFVFISRLAVDVLDVVALTDDKKSVLPQDEILARMRQFMPLTISPWGATDPVLNYQGFAKKVPHVAAMEPVRVNGYEAYALRYLKDAELYGAAATAVRLALKSIPKYNAHYKQKS